MPPPDASPDEVLTGRLHIFVAFDWGDEIDLTRARQQGPGVVLDMMRRSRTPASIAYRPPPLRFPLGPVVITMPGLTGAAVRSAEATVFDFGAVSVALQLPFSATRAGLRDLAAQLAEPPTAVAIMQATRGLLEPLYHKLMPAIAAPAWRENFWEEYFVFQFPPGPGMAPGALLGEHADWLAGLLRLEDERLSEQEVAEALRYTLRYGQNDVFIPDWGAAVLVDEEGPSDETLQAVEFANLQLLELRHIDERLDGVLAQADTLLRRAARSRLSLFRAHGRALRELGELKVEANGLFERAGNALKLIGDQYLARAYRLLATRFHLPEWGENVRRKLEVLEGIYQVMANQASHFRSELLEIIIVLLITVEIVMALFFKH